VFCSSECAVLSFGLVLVKIFASIEYDHQAVIFYSQSRDKLYLSCLTDPSVGFKTRLIQSIKPLLSFAGHHRLREVYHDLLEIFCDVDVHLYSIQRLQSLKIVLKKMCLAFLAHGAPHTGCYWFNTLNQSFHPLRICTISIQMIASGCDKKISPSRWRHFESPIDGQLSSLCSQDVASAGSTPIPVLLAGRKLMIDYSAESFLHPHRHMATLFGIRPRDIDSWLKIAN
jgi:hypothetical protein